MNHHFQTSQRLQKYLIDIIKSALSSSATNSVEINTNLDCNVPEKDIHKIAGPFIDEWTYEIFNRASSTHTNIKSVTSKESSSLEDIYISLELDGITCYITFHHLPLPTSLTFSPIHSKNFSSRFIPPITNCFINSYTFSSLSFKLRFSSLSI